MAVMAGTRQKYPWQVPLLPENGIGNRLFVGLLALFLLAPRAAAQIEAELIIDEDQYLPNEALVVGVRITNFSGRTLRLGADEDWLNFAVESVQGFIVNKIGDPPVVEEFQLPSASKATRRVDLAPYYSLSRPGRYLISAAVRIPGTEKVLVTKTKGVNIMSGARLWEQEFGIPGGRGTEPEVRKYTLLQASNQRQIKLYVRVTDQQETVVYRVFPIGTLISFSKPEAQVDQTSQLHVLFQVGARAFSYNVIRPNGEQVVRQVYQYTNTRPVLRGDQDGKLVVTGGARVVTQSDIPKPPPPGEEKEEPTSAKSAVGEPQTPSVKPVPDKGDAPKKD